jgi:methylase of polypeptide subunit release factors
VRDRTAYQFKRHAIQKCLYGVDIDPGAVEIAKLRLWLSLVVDEDDVKQIKPLPNLDYKVVAGNSLIGVEKTLFNIDQLNRLEELKPRYFDATDRKQKEQFKREIDRLINELTNGKEAFDFEIFFSEVFHKRGGFDVAIGNPPYVTYHGRRRELIPKKDLDYLKQHYVCAFEKKKDGKHNSAMFFIERFVRICSPTGISACITDISFYEHFYQGLKKYLLEITRVLNVVNGLSSFENVASGQLLIIVAKARDTEDALSNTVRINNGGIQSEAVCVNQLE